MVIIQSLKVNYNERIQNNVKTNCLFRLFHIFTFYAYITNYFNEMEILHPLYGTPGDFDRILISIFDLVITYFLSLEVIS